jgi:hypothetical protein
MMKAKCVGAILGAALFASAPAASFAAPSNEPSGNASCVGALSVFNEAHPEFFGTRSDVAHAFIEEAAAAGIPPGQIYTGFAQTHGTVHTCG